jgi:hypothetical protein
MYYKPPFLKCTKILIYVDQNQDICNYGRWQLTGRGNTWIFSEYRDTLWTY